jgi:hypothetical protein
MAHLPQDVFQVQDDVVGHDRADIVDPVRVQAHGLQHDDVPHGAPHDLRGQDVVVVTEAVGGSGRRVIGSQPLEILETAKVEPEQRFPVSGLPGLLVLHVERQVLRHARPVLPHPRPRSPSVDPDQGLTPGFDPFLLIEKGVGIRHGAFDGPEIVVEVVDEIHLRGEALPLPFGLRVLPKLLEHTDAARAGFFLYDGPDDLSAAHCPVPGITAG